MTCRLCAAFFRRVRNVQSQRARQTQRAGHERQAGPHKGEQLQHIEQHHVGARAQPSGDKGGMGDQHIAAFEQGARIAQFDALGLVVGAR